MSTVRNCDKIRLRLFPLLIQHRIERRVVISACCICIAANKQYCARIAQNVLVWIIRNILRQNAMMCLFLCLNPQNSIRQTCTDQQQSFHIVRMIDRTEFQDNSAIAFPPQINAVRINEIQRFCKSKHSFQVADARGIVRRKEICSVTFGGGCFPVISAAAFKHQTCDFLFTKRFRQSNIAVCRAVAAVDIDDERYFFSLCQILGLDLHRVDAAIHLAIVYVVRFLFKRILCQADCPAQRGDLKPEISSSIEFGTEWRFFHHRFGIDFTWYQTNTKNQLLRMDNPTGSTYKYRYVNAGKIRNQGFELTVDATPLLYRNFSWKSLINMSANKNKVVTLHPDYPEFSYYEEGFNAGHQMRVKEGGSLGDIYGNAFRRNEDGSIMVDETSKRPLGNTGNKDLLGNANPDFTMGWSNTLTYTDLELYFLIDFRFGGEVMSLTQSELDANGVTKVTEDARARGYVEYQGPKFNDPRAFYSAVGGRNAISEYYMYDATCIRLREVSLSYSFPKTILENSRFIKGIDVSLAARNLCFLKKEAPFDPDAVMSVGNNNQGVDVFGMPTTRNIGFNLRLTF